MGTIISSLNGYELNIWRGCKVSASEESQRGLGIGTGNPGVLQGYPYPYPRKPVPFIKGTGFCGLG
jgi:hypothetical protein